MFPGEVGLCAVNSVASPATVVVLSCFGGKQAETNVSVVKSPTSKNKEYSQGFVNYGYS
jgi:hypothetical protein